MTLQRIIVFVLTSLLVSACAGPDKEIRQKQGAATRSVGEAYMQEGNYTAALRELLKAEELTPDDADLHNDLGLVYMAKEKLDLAIRHFNRALSIKPDYTAARNNLGTAYLAKQDWDSAIATFEAVLEDLLYATPHFAQANIAWAYFNKKDYAKAERYYREALRNQPRFVIALRGLARTQSALGNHAEAIETLDKALDLTPRFPLLYLDLADIYAASGNTGEAVNTYKKVIALFPDTEYADTAKKKAGELLLRTGGGSS